MIIFDLDNVLADVRPRMHLIDASKNNNYVGIINPIDDETGSKWFHKKTNQEFKPDWKSFYEASEHDIAIQGPLQLLRTYLIDRVEVEIWTEREEFFREQTNKWLIKHLNQDIFDCLPPLRMRPNGDYVPIEDLKSRWVEDFSEVTKWGTKYFIDFVFDAHAESVKMWRNKGIFVFDCNQN